MMIGEVCKYALDAMILRLEDARRRCRISIGMATVCPWTNLRGKNATIAISTRSTVIVTIPAIAKCMIAVLTTNNPKFSTEVLNNAKVITTVAHADTKARIRLGKHLISININAIATSPAIVFAKPTR